MRESHWTKMLGGAAILGVGFGFIGDAFDDYFTVSGGVAARDFDEGLILVGVFLITMGLIFVLKGARSYLRD
jgi:hypothetical protein